MIIKAQLNNLAFFSLREGDVVILLAQGISDKDIGRTLGISLKTVQVHLNSIYGKLKITNTPLNSRCTALLIMIARGILTVSYQSEDAFMQLRVITN